MLDEIYANEDNEEMRESFEDRLLSGEGEEENETEQRLYEFQRTIEKLRATFNERKLKKTEQKAQTE